MNSAGTFDLTGKIAAVTGASRGIGEAIAKLLAAHGAHVIISSRKRESCQAVAEAIQASGGSAEAIPCHIGELAQIEAFFQNIQAKHGRLDILVNNAATNPYFGPIVDTDVEAFEKTVDVNIRGYFFMSARAVKLMAKVGGGAIVNVSSISAVLPGNGQGIYSITKAAIVSMTKAFAKECAAAGVRVNALLPGLTDTKFAAAVVKNPKLHDEKMRRIPMRRVADPSEMAAAVLYLVSPQASYTTGACLAVDGGSLLG